MGMDFYIQLMCPACHRSRWVHLSNSRFSKGEILNTAWRFECPVHGGLKEKPLQVSHARPISFAAE